MADYSLSNLSLLRGLLYWGCYISFGGLLSDNDGSCFACGLCVKLDYFGYFSAGLRASNCFCLASCLRRCFYCFFSFLRCLFDIVLTRSASFSLPATTTTSFSFTSSFSYKISITGCTSIFSVLLLGAFCCAC